MLGADRTEISLEYQSPADGSSVARSGDRDFGTSRLEGRLAKSYSSPLAPTRGKEGP